MTPYGIIIFAPGELSCPDCDHGYLPNPDFEKCRQYGYPQKAKDGSLVFPDCGSEWFCRDCAEATELISCDTCNGTGRIP